MTVYYKSSSNMEEIEDESIHLIVTSPPYPMISKWDNHYGIVDFEIQHHRLLATWGECYRVLIHGGIMCVNIGDATRTIGKKFQLFPSHARIIEHFLELGFQSLPEIIWRKQTNAPNKFMGSGMYPPGAYVTLEHEFILIFRK